MQANDAQYKKLLKRISKSLDARYPLLKFKLITQKLRTGWHYACMMYDAHSTLHFNISYTISYVHVLEKEMLHKTLFDKMVKDRFYAIYRPTNMNNNGLYPIYDRMDFVKMFGKSYEESCIMLDMADFEKT